MLHRSHGVSDRRLGVGQVAPLAPPPPPWRRHCRSGPEQIRTAPGPVALRNRKTNKVTAGRIKAPYNESRPKDPAGRSRAPQKESGPRGTDQGPAGRTNARNRYESGPCRTNQSPVWRPRAPQDGQGSQGRSESTELVRAPLDEPGSQKTNQSPAIRTRVP